MRSKIVLLVMFAVILGTVLRSPYFETVFADDGGESNDSSPDIVLGNTDVSEINNQTTLVRLLNFKDPKFDTAVPMDWSPDGQSILIQYSIVDESKSLRKHGLALADPELTNIKELSIPSSFPPGQSINGNEVFVEQPVTRALFSPSYRSHNENNTSANEDIIFFQWREELYSFSINSNKLEKLLDGIVFFDITSSPQEIAYSQYDGGKNIGRVGIFSLNTRTSTPILENVPTLYTFDLSPDDKQILYRQTSEPLKYYDLESKQTRAISGVFVGCSDLVPRWTPLTSSDSRFVVYEESGCPKGWVGASINVTSIDGQNQEIIIPPSVDNPQHFLISPDGKSLLVTFGGIVNNGTLSNLGKADMYRLDRVTAIPEFGAVSILLSAVAVATALTAIRFRLWK